METIVVEDMEEDMEVGMVEDMEEGMEVGMVEDMVVGTVADTEIIVIRVAQDMESPRRVPWHL